MHGLFRPIAAAVLAAALAGSPLRLVSRERPASRPVTRFEQQGLAAGRTPHDLVAERP